jgi:hypothetical protein
MEAKNVWIREKEKVSVMRFQKDSRRRKRISKGDAIIRSNRRYCGGNPK